MKFKTILADPPYNETGGGRIKRGADRHYQLMKTKDIIALSDMVKQITDKNAHCYLWVTNNHLKDGLDILEAWGFRYITMITWIKDRQGLGQYYRGLTEHILFGVKGMLPYKLLNGKRQQGLTGYFHKKSKHSEKPELFRKVIEKVSYPPYIELFARKKTENWSVWGNEIPDEIQLKIGD